MSRSVCSVWLSRSCVQTNLKFSRSTFESWEIAKLLIKGGEKSYLRDPTFSQHALVFLHAEDSLVGCGEFYYFQLFRGTQTCVFFALCILCDYPSSAQVCWRWDQEAALLKRREIRLPERKQRARYVVIVSLVSLMNVCLSSYEIENLFNIIVFSHHYSGL